MNNEGRHSPRRKVGVARLSQRGRGARRLSEQVPGLNEILGDKRLAAVAATAECSLRPRPGQGMENAESGVQRLEPTADEGAVFAAVRSRALSVPGFAPIEAAGTQGAERGLPAEAPAKAGWLSAAPEIREGENSPRAVSEASMAGMADAPALRSAFPGAGEGEGGARAGGFSPAPTEADEKMIALLERQTELLEELVRVSRNDDPLILR